MMVFCWANSRLANEQELWVQWDSISRFLEMRIAFSWVTSAQTAGFSHFHRRLAPRFVQLSIQWKSSMRANSSFGPREACQGPGLPSLVNASVEIVLFDVVCAWFCKWGTAAVKTHSSFFSPNLASNFNKAPSRNSTRPVRPLATSEVASGIIDPRAVGLLLSTGLDYWGTTKPLTPHPLS